MVSRKLSQIIAGHSKRFLILTLQQINQFSDIISLEFSHIVLPELILVEYTPFQFTFFQLLAVFFVGGEKQLLLLKDRFDFSQVVIEIDVFDVLLLGDIHVFKDVFVDHDLLTLGTGINQVLWGRLNVGSVVGSLQQKYQMQHGRFSLCYESQLR